MKQFNLEEYLRLKEAGKEPKIVTRDGRSVRILCTNLKSENYPIACALDLGNRETVTIYPREGYFCGHESVHDYDLFFAPTKHERWVNVYRTPITKEAITSNLIFSSKEEAVSHLTSTYEYVTTVKIEWTE